MPVTQISTQKEKEERDKHRDSTKTSLTRVQFNQKQCTTYLSKALSLFRQHSTPVPKDRRKYDLASTEIIVQSYSKSNRQRNNRHTCCSCDTSTSHFESIASQSFSRSRSVASSSTCTLVTWVTPHMLSTNST